MDHSSRKEKVCKTGWTDDKRFQTVAIHSLHVRSCDKHGKPPRHAQFDATFSTSETEDQTDTEPSPSTLHRHEATGSPGSHDQHENTNM